MSSDPSIYDSLSIHDFDTKEEFLDEYLSVFEEQYSYDRLEGLPVKHLEKEIEYANHDLSALGSRLIGGDDLTSPVPEDLFTKDQVQQINWGVIRVERNINRAIAEQESNQRGFFSSIKRIFLGSNIYGNLEIERFSEESAVANESIDRNE